MTDETETKQSEEQPKADPAVEKAERKAQAMAKQIIELREKLQEFEASKTAEAQKLEQRALEAKGDYEAALKLRDQEIAQYKQQMEQREREFNENMLRGQLERALIAKGATDEIFIEGAIGRYMRLDDRPDPAEYIAEVAAKSERYFKPSPPPNVGYDGRVETPRSTNEWEARRQTIAQGLKFGKQPPEALREITEANAAVREYVLKHGVLPDGFAPQGE